MARHVTEIAIFPVREDIPEDLSNFTGQVLRESMVTLFSHPGIQRVHWGLEVDNPKMCRLFVDWETLEHHLQTRKLSMYKPFRDKFATMTEIDEMEVYHVALTPHPATVLGNKVSPVTEIITAFFPANYSRVDQDRYESNVAQLLAGFEHQSEAFITSSRGWVVHWDQIAKADEDSKAYVIVIGWQSVQAHHDFRGTNVYKDHIHLLRHAKDMKKLQEVLYVGHEFSN